MENLDSPSKGQKRSSEQPLSSDGKKKRTAVDVADYDGLKAASEVAGADGDAQHQQSEARIKQEYAADTDDDEDDRSSGVDVNMMQTIKQEYAADTDDDDDGKLPAEKEKNGGADSDVDDEEKDPLTPLKQFPKEGPRTFILHRVAGDDVLQILMEHKAEGVLEIDSSTGTSAKFWVKFPDEKGVVAGRIDYAGLIDGRPPTYFTAVASKAYINYGIWQGCIHRDFDTPGANIYGGSMVTMGVNLAEAGNMDFSASNPLYIDTIHAVDLNEDEPLLPDPPDSEYTPMKAGCICVTLYIEDGKSSYRSGRDAPVPVCFWFRPQELPANSTVKIPDDIVEDIDKLPPSECTS
mmetsp:Transcript_11686/g.21604  ORF Transcript_11686/g.21604 Transcript_11686/m.21604 type:complete len:350 (-) Transcript_11686:48-1097(-)